MIPNNEIAIMLTQQIMLELKSKQLTTFIDDGDHSRPELLHSHISGSYYNVREAILTALNNIVETVSIDYTWSPLEIARQDKEFKKLNEERVKDVLSAKASKAIIEQKMYELDSYDPTGDGWKRIDRYTVSVINLSKLAKGCTNV